MINIKEFLENSNEGDEIRDLFADYKGSSTYICDAISERADSLIDIYNCDLIDWAKNHICEIDDAADELGKPDSFIGYIQQGQFIYYEHELYDQLDDGIKWAVYSILDDAGIEELTDEQESAVDDFIDEIDNNNRFSDLDEVLNFITEDSNND